jgi:hypothetical protein
MDDTTILGGSDKSAIQRAMDQCKAWGEKHQAEIGVVEMALGASIIAWAVANGEILIGRDIVGSSIDKIGGTFGMGVGAAAGSTLAATMLKGIFIGGVGGIQGVTAVPALVIIGGATAIFGAFSYVGGSFAAPNIVPDISDLVKDASALAIGVGLLVDGACRLIGDQQRLASLTRYTADGVIHYSRTGTRIVARTGEELNQLALEVSASSVAKLAAVSGAGGGIIAGTIAASGMVTVLGSSTLGGIALPLGLVSAPIWPVIAGGAGGLALGVAAWKGVQQLRRSGSKSRGPKLLPAPVSMQTSGKEGE